MSDPNNNPSADAVSATTTHPVKHDLVKAIVMYEGQEYEVPPHIGASDTLLREALRPLGVNFDNATFAREAEKTDTGNVMRIRVTKSYATKGAFDETHPFAALIDTEPFITPVIELEWRLRQHERDGTLDYITLISTRAEIDRAIKQSDHEAAQARVFMQALIQAAPVPLDCVLEGF